MNTILRYSLQRVVISTFFILSAACGTNTPPSSGVGSTVVWQQGFEVISFALLDTGEIKGLVAPNKQVDFQNA